MQNLLEQFAELFAPKKEKVEQFAVIITDEGRAELYIKKFRRLLKEYPFLKQNPKDKISLSKLSFGDIVVFGNNSSYDYTITDEPLMKLRKFIMYDLISDETRIASALDRYVEKNGICPCWPKAVKKNNYDVTITVTLEENPKPKKIATLEVVDIYDAFVKVGWNIYYTTTDTWTGKQYVSIDGNVFEIKTNRFGQKFLG